MTTRRIALYLLNNDATYLYSCSVERFPKEIKFSICNKYLYQTCSECKHIPQSCADIFALDLLSISLQVEL